MKKSRYSITINLEILCRDDDEAKILSKLIASRVDRENDNKARVLSIVNKEFASFGNGREVSI